jgi:predicted nucleotidyltransferase
LECGPPRRAAAFPARRDQLAGRSRDDHEQARGDAEPGSDIDVLVVLEGPVRPGEEIARTGEIASGMSLENNVVISCTFISADRIEREESPLMINARREGAPV